MCSYKRLFEFGRFAWTYPDGENATENFEAFSNRDLSANKAAWTGLQLQSNSYYEWRRWVIYFNFTETDGHLSSQAPGDGAGDKRQSVGAFLKDMVFRTIAIRTLKISGGILLLIVLYLVSAFGLSSISVNSDFEQCEKDAVEIHILTNGVHTDLVLPFQNQYMDWSKFVNPADTRSGNRSPQNVAFGWGDKGFYLQTKTWDDLKFSTAFNALFHLSTSAMHVTFYNGLSETESCRKICINKESYQKLVDYITGSFSLDSLGVPRQIAGASYWDNDSFYEAKGAYSLFFTCNTWANNGLKAADLKACLWTPFESGIFKKYHPRKKLSRH